MLEKSYVKAEKSMIKRIRSTFPRFRFGGFVILKPFGDGRFEVDATFPADSDNGEMLFSSQFMKMRQRNIKQRKNFIFLQKFWNRGFCHKPTITFFANKSALEPEFRFLVEF